MNATWTKRHGPTARWVIEGDLSRPLQKTASHRPGPAPCTAVQFISDASMTKFKLELQQQIIRAALDDFSPNAMLPATNGGQFGETPTEWRKAVVSLVRSLVAAELITPISGLENYQDKSSEEIARLLEVGDPDNGFDAELVWDIMHFFGTPKLRALMKELALDSWDALQSGLSLPLGKALAEMHVVCTTVAGWALAKAA